MNKILDITFDLETCDTAPTAAPMQLAAVAWDRTRTEKDGDPFLKVTDEHSSIKEIAREHVEKTGDTPKLECYNLTCDLTAALMDGLTFSQDTINFWSRQPREVQQTVLGNEGEERFPPSELYKGFFEWVEDLKDATGSDHVVLWCQGQDFDIPMMKHCAAKYNLKMPFNQYSFRDCRTLAFEMALLNSGRTDEIFGKPKSAPYEYLPPIPDELMGYSHDARFDCIRSTWSTWHAMLQLRRWQKDYI